MLTTLRLHEDRVYHYLYLFVTSLGKAVNLFKIEIVDWNDILMLFKAQKLSY